MNQMKRRNFLRVGLGSAAVLVAPKTFAAEKALDLSSKQVAALFSEFAQTKKMSPELKAWLDDPVIQKIPPYKVFDNVWYVGLRWVAAYLIKTNDGYILIDTLHPPFVGHLIDNLALLNVDPSEIKYVLMTHGHFDHVGGATTLKPLFKNAKFAMGEKGWEESFEKWFSKTVRPSRSGTQLCAPLPLRDIPKEPSPMFTRFMQTVKNTRLSRSAESV